MKVIKTMAKIKIMRLLCPLNHCIAGLGYDPDKHDEEKVKKLILAGLGATNFTPCCASCGGRNLHYQASATNFDTVAEAMPAIEALARKYAAERDFIKNIRRAAQNN